MEAIEPQVPCPSGRSLMSGFSEQTQGSALLSALWPSCAPCLGSLAGSFLLSLAFSLPQLLERRYPVSSGCVVLVFAKYSSLLFALRLLLVPLLIISFSSTTVPEPAWFSSL